MSSRETYTMGDEPESEWSKDEVSKCLQCDFNTKGALPRLALSCFE